MAQPGSVCGMAAKAFTVSGNQNECSMASARSNCFCASGLQEVLNSTRPTPLPFACKSSLCASTLKLANANTDATNATMDLRFMELLPDVERQSTLMALGAAR